MPSLFRFLTAIAVLVGIGYAAVFALATMVEPQSREMTVTVPQDRFVKQR